MDFFLQSRSSKGKIPVHNIVTKKGNTECEIDDADRICFIPYNPSESSELPPEDPPSHPGSGLLELALCIERTISGPHASVSSLVRFASSSGPLFGRSPIESLEDWASASLAADLAVSVQQVVNGHKLVPSLAYLDNNIVKNKIVDQDNAETYIIYDITYRCSKTYLNWLSNLPLVCHEKTDCAFIYSFVLDNHVHAGDSDYYYVEIIVVRFNHEMSWKGYRSLCDYMGIDNEQEAQIAKALDLTGNDPGIRPGEGLLLSYKEELALDDLNSLDFLVRTLLKAHLCDAYVDPFQADKDTGLLSFNSYLSWLWFDFSKCLSNINIGYCAQCGRPFSLIGHRGRERRFCSSKCKTDAKNERMKNRRDSVRSEFLSGADISEIAKKCLGNEYTKKAAEARVRSWLESSRELRQSLDADIRLHGTKSVLLRRCLEEGLNGSTILSPASRRALGI